MALDTSRLANERMHQAQERVQQFAKEVDGLKEEVTALKTIVTALMKKSGLELADLGLNIEAEEQGIPAPKASISKEMADEMDPEKAEKMEIEFLKRELGDREIAYHHNAGVKKLRELYQEALEAESSKDESSEEDEGETE